MYTKIKLKEAVIVLGIGCKPGLGICSSVFWANRSFFAQKWANERFAQKNKRFTTSLTFIEWPERFAHDRSFLVSDLWKSLMVAHLLWVTWAICTHRSFFWWATWAICSHRSPKSWNKWIAHFFNKKTYIKHTKK